MKTALYDKHAALGARIVDFNGWQMPLQYKGILHEHKMVREGVGIFDVSHMGRLLVSGPDAARFLDYLSTNTIADKADGTATYTVWADDKGGCVDDVIVYRVDNDHFFVVVNAGNRDKDLAHMHREASAFNVTITPLYDGHGILAIQGPKADTLIAQIFPAIRTLKPFHFTTLDYNGSPIILSKTGYTGAGGAEIYAPDDAIVSLWELFFEIGKQYHLEPIGLGARDTLRLEMGYALYGHELSDTISPKESVSAWTVKNSKEFIGKSALVLSQGRRQYGVVMESRGIPRAGCDVCKDGTPIGIVTSGTHSPTLNKGIAIVMTATPLSAGEQVEVVIRNMPCTGIVTSLPFIRQKEHST